MGGTDDKADTPNTADQREDCKVGPGKPPREYQWKPGQSGNPNGPKIRRTNLWLYINEYMATTEAELAKVNRSKLTQAQQLALRLVESAKRGDGCKSERLARYCIDRDEGKAVEHLIVDNANLLTDHECDDIRRMLRKAHAEQ